MWSQRESIAKCLSRGGVTRLLDARRQLARHFGEPEGEDLGSRQPAPVPLMPAHTRYDGNLYRKIDKSLWPEVAKLENVAVIIISALYGLLIPGEAIREYNRTMGETIAPRLRLARWWSERGLGSLLVEYIKRNKVAVVHDFLSGSYVRIANELSSLGPTVKVQHHSYPGLGSGADYHRGQDVRKLLVRELRNGKPNAMGTAP